MITFVDLAPLAHVRILLRVPVPLATGGWTWGVADVHPDDLAREWAYTDAETRSLVHVYGRTVGRVMSRPELGDRFRISAFGLTTGLCVGLREYEWSTEAREYRPVGEYLSGWREAIRAYYLKTGEFFEEKRFTARIGCVEAPHAERLPMTSLAARLANAA